MATDTLEFMLTVWSLNGARFSGTTAQETPQTLRWLKGLSQPGAVVPDVLCLQDFRVSLLAELRALPYFHFVPMTNSWYFGKRELLGICIASRWPITAIDVVSTWGDGVLRDLEGVDTTNERIADKALSDALVLKTQNRVAMACSVMAPGFVSGLRVATHHGFWTRDGANTPEQMLSTHCMTDFLTAQAQEHGGLLFMADFNPDKFGKVHSAYVARGGRDWLPSDIKTTLSPDHPAAKFGIKSDCVMTWPDASGAYDLHVGNVRLDDAPASDHLLLCCEVERTGLA